MRPKLWHLPAASLVLLVSACGGSAQPATLPPLALGAAGAVIARPAAPDAETAVGAAAFVRFYFEQLNAAYLALDLAPLAGLTDPRCRSCANFAGDITAMVANRHHLVGDTFEVISSDAPPIENHVAVVNLLFRSPGPVEYQASGQVLLRRPTTDATAYIVTVIRDGGSWRVREVQLP